MATEKALGIVLTGLGPGADATVRAFAARGYEVLAAEPGLENVRAAMAALAGRKIAVVGYGRGGSDAFLAVTRLGADGAAAFYGAGIGAHLSEAARAVKPLSLHFGDADERVPFEEVRAIKGALEGFGTTEIYRYPNVGHGFALRGDPGYDESAAQDAERRVFSFLESLGGV
ncbi:MAG TPA: dienelactone hydrolase family protein [Candidatus Lustribacter sp.]|jgi:carboxymethylenebutenolidase|nr:dienelactone hydrolase family protein [Candidatus Lustribacter sp.]